MTEPQNLPDPLIENPASTEEEMSEHVRTYRNFTRLLGWFIVHVPFVLIGLYVMTLGGQLSGGLALLALGLAILVFGIGRMAA